MRSLIEYLKTEHVYCATAFSRTEQAVSGQQWTDALAAFCDFEGAHMRHLIFEEDYLFPAIDAEADIVAGPTDLMRGDHGQMRTWLRAMHDALIDCDARHFGELAQRFRKLVTTHENVEESLLYPMVDRVLGAKALVILGAAREVAAARNRVQQQLHSQP